MTQSTLPGETERSEGRLLCRGAEADIIGGEWQGLDAVFKVRRPLKYRIPVLDGSIRLQRTVHEAQMIHAAGRAGLHVPRLFYVDPGEATIVMERIEGERVKDLVGEVSSAEAARIFREIGRDVARLHSSRIVHGDLTTANVIRRRSSLVYVDFGLSTYSTRVEDFAVDLRLIKETIAGAHAGESSAAIRSLTKGYLIGAGAKRARAVFAQLRSIERRGRYARVV